MHLGIATNIVKMCIRDSFLCGAELGQVVDRFYAAVFFTQDGIEAGVGFTGLFCRKAGGGKGRVQLGLVLPVFPRGLRQVEEALGQSGEGGSGGDNSGTCLLYTSRCV